MLATEECDPTLEQCSSNELVEETIGGFPLFAVWSSFPFLSAAMVIGDFLTTLWEDHAGQAANEDDIGEILGFQSKIFIPQAIDWAAYLWPLVAVLMYWFAGAEAVPTTLVWLIEVWVSNYNFLSFVPNMVVVVILLASGVQDDVLLGLFYGLQRLFWNLIVLMFSGNAIRSLDPSWAAVESGAWLCPSILYGLGVCSYAEGWDPAEKEEDLDEED